jgi:predicted Fe-S protein YdhL (DUF1289 family)
VEISNWSRMSDAQKQRIIARLTQEKALKDEYA